MKDNDYVMRLMVPLACRDRVDPTVWFLSFAHLVKVLSLVWFRIGGTKVENKSFDLCFLLLGGNFHLP